MTNSSCDTEAADVVVVGTGAPGLTAAILAHDNGAKVVLVERTDKVGGASAVSGGGLWVPLNNHLDEVGASDSRDEALAYCKALSMGRVEDLVIETFIDTAAAMVTYLEKQTPLKFRATSAPDYQTETIGAKLGGRTIEPVPFELGELGASRERLRSPSSLAFPVTLQEVYNEFQAFYQPWKIPSDLLVDRMTRGIVCLGQALVAPLFKAVEERGIPILLNTRVRKLQRDGERITGVVAERDGTPLSLSANAGVILATGGFEWNEALKRRFLSYPITHPNSPPYGEGDGLVMAMEVGADLANMAEVWNYPSIAVPGETYDDRPLSRGVKAERSGPHVIWVNKRGQRFVNEAANYNSIGKAFASPETAEPGYRNLPAWAILDSQYREKYVLGTSMPDDPLPAWVKRGDSLAELARLVDVDPQGLEETVERWNSFCARGMDRDFGRGDSAFDRYQGDHQAPHPNLGTIDKPPFFAFPIVTGALGTKGGPRTNENAQVVNVRGEAIEGLYAVGNVAASLSGPSYFGAGSTLGPGMTWGYIAGIHAAKRAQERNW